MNDERRVRPTESDSVSDGEGELLNTVVKQLLCLKSGNKSEESISVSTALELRSQNNPVGTNGTPKQDQAVERVRAKRRYEQKKYRERVKHRQVELAATVGALEAELSTARAEHEVLKALQRGLLQVQDYQTGLISSIYKSSNDNRSRPSQPQEFASSQLAPKVGGGPPNTREGQAEKDRSWSWAFWELISNYPEVWNHLCNLVNNNETEVLGTQYCELLSKFRGDARAAIDSLKLRCNKDSLIPYRLEKRYNSLNRNAKVSQSDIKATTTCIFMDY